MALHASTAAPGRTAARPQVRSERAPTAPPIQVWRTVSFRRATTDAVISRIPTRRASASRSRAALAALVVLGLGMALVYAGIPMFKNIAGPLARSGIANQAGETR